MKLPVYTEPEGGDPAFWLGDSSADTFDVDGNRIALAMTDEMDLYADVPVAFVVASRGHKALISPRPKTREARAAFLAGEGTLTVEDVRQWARQLGLDYELDGCKDPTPELMVAGVRSGPGLYASSRQLAKAARLLADAEPTVANGRAEERPGWIVEIGNRLKLTIGILTTEDHFINRAGEEVLP
jgi:hypothetical protein